MGLQQREVTGSVTVADGGGSITVDGSVTANPAEVTLTTISGVCDSSGANTLVAAPAAGNHHVLYAFQFAGKEAPTTLQNVLLKSDTTELWNVPITEIGSGLLVFLPPGQELHWDSATAIVADLAEAKDVAYVLRYKTIAD